MDFHFARGALQDIAAFETERAQHLAGGSEEIGEDGMFDDLGEMLEDGPENEVAQQEEEREEEEGEKDLFDELAEMFE